MQCDSSAYDSIVWSEIRVNHDCGGGAVFCSTHSFVTSISDTSFFSTFRNPAMNHSKKRLYPKVTMFILRSAILCIALVATDAFAPVGQPTRSSPHSPQRTIVTSSRSAATTFFDGLRGLGNSKPSTTSKADTSKLGNLIVPNVGIGTISWSSTNRK